jgi:hypothetical protein
MGRPFGGYTSAKALHSFTRILRGEHPDLEFGAERADIAKCRTRYRFR